MGEDQPRVGEHLQQRGQIEHVLRGLEYPGAQRTALLRPADQPQQVGHMAIGGRGVLALAPTTIGRHMPLRLVLHPPHARNQQTELLLRLVRSGGVDGQRPGIGEPGDLHDPLRQDRPEIVLFAHQHLFIAGARNRADRLEAAQMAEPPIACQQSVQPRGARAHRPDDDHRPADRTRQYLRMALEPPLGPQPIAQHMAKLVRRREFARRIEARLRAYRIEQYLHRPLEPAIAEIG